MLNKAILMGRLTADPELKTTTNSISVCSFTIAVDRGYVKAGAQRQTDFIDIVTWRQTAEFVSKYFSKGKLIAVEGSIQTRSYTDNAGNKRKVFEIVADSVHFCESKNSSQPSGANFETSTPAFTNGNVGDFEETFNDNDLPF